MRAFSELYEELDTTTSTNLKVAAMVRYFNNAAPAAVATDPHPSGAEAGRVVAEPSRPGGTGGAGWRKDQRSAEIRFSVGPDGESGQHADTRPPVDAG